ncbi:MAG: hypothetical protein KatS3mg022_3541 [Armatimonadota bacterium]|nr:MAG: hypothetical protein KatS3mg022_3541 [Armatimonadota bacterium]
MFLETTRRLEVAGNNHKTPFGGWITCVSRFRSLLPAIFNRWDNTNIFRKRSDKVEDGFLARSTRMPPMPFRLLLENLRQSQDFRFLVRCADNLQPQR